MMTISNEMKGRRTLKCNETTIIIVKNSAQHIHIDEILIWSLNSFTLKSFH